MTRTVTIPVDLKFEALSANGRVHWAVRQARTKALRDKGRYAIAAALVPPMIRAHLTVTVHWPDRRRRDVANLSPTIKALIDGMVSDAGLLPDDDDTHLIGPDLRVAQHVGVDHRLLVSTTGVPGLAILRFDWDDLTPDGAK